MLRIVDYLLGRPTVEYLEWPLEDGMDKERCKELSQIGYFITLGQWRNTMSLVKTPIASDVQNLLLEGTINLCVEIVKGTIQNESTQAALFREVWAELIQSGIGSLWDDVIAKVKFKIEKHKRTLQDKRASRPRSSEASSSCAAASDAGLEPLRRARSEHADPEEHDDDKSERGTGSSMVPSATATGDSGLKTDQC